MLPAAQLASLVQVLDSVVVSTGQLSGAVIAGQVDPAGGGAFSCASVGPGTGLLLASQKVGAQIPCAAFGVAKCSDVKTVSPVLVTVVVLPVNDGAKQGDGGGGVFGTGGLGRVGATPVPAPSSG